MKKHVAMSEIWDIVTDHVSDSFRNRESRISTLSGSIAGTILAEDVISKRNLPHYTASAVDGYAIRSESTIGASPATPVYLEDNDFYWVNTGMAVPDKFDCVLMVENSTTKGNNLLVYENLTVGKNLRTVGEDVYCGQVIARKGDIISPYLAALIPVTGVTEISVFPKVQTAFLPTGDEIVHPDKWISSDNQDPGNQMESNSIMLKSLFGQWGYPLEVFPIIPDDPVELRRYIEEAVQNYDMVLVGAGSAKGRKDFVQKVLSEMGKVLFHWTLMKPGRPAMMAEIKGKPVIGMPGFPMSTAVAAWSIVFPTLNMLNFGEIDREEVLEKAVGAVETLKDVTLVSPHSSPSGIEEWVRIKAFQINDQKAVFPVSGGSSKMLSMAEMDGVSLIPQESLEFPKGSKFPYVWLTRDIKWNKRALYQGSNDPAFDRIISFVRDRGGDLITRYVGSLGGLAALSRKEAHLAAAHLLDPSTGEYNTSYINELAGEDKWERILLFYREQGIIVKKGNPRNIKRISDLVDQNIRFVNRQPGAGTRVLLDYLLTDQGLDHSLISGYDNCTVSHFDAANQVKVGNVDAAMGIHAASYAMDLDFIPLTEEPFELVIPRNNIDHPAISALMESITNKEWKQRVTAMGGYRWAT